MTERHPSNVIIVDGEPLFLAKNGQTNAPEWAPTRIATQEGDPTRPRRYRWNDWSRGLGDSRGAFKGAVEHSEFAFLGAVGRILPGHAIGVIETNCDAAITSFVEVTAPANRILAGGGTKVVEVDTSHAVQATQTMPGGSLGPMQLFNGQVAIPLGDAQQFYRRKADGTYAVSTTTSDVNGDYRYARCFGLNGSKLVRGYGNNWSVCAAADFYGTDGNWSADYPIGDPAGKINQVFSHNRWDYVLKDEGLYSFDQETSEEANLLTDLIAFKSSENRQFAQWHDQILLCSFAGLYRYLQQGAARTTGAEEMELNEGVLRNTFPTAAKAFGKWAFVAHYKASTSTTYIVMHRRAREGDATFGTPVTAVCVIYSFTGRCNAMHITSLGGTPELWFAKDTDVAWLQLTRDGLPAAFQTGATTRVDFAPTDLDSPFTAKYGRSVEVVGRNIDADRTIQVKVAWDDAASAAVGGAITSLSTTFAQRYFVPGVSDSGRVVQVSIELTNDDAGNPPEVRDVALNYEERPLMTDGFSAVFRLRDFAEEGDFASRLTAKEQRDFIAARVTGAPVEIIDAYGDAYVAALSSFEGQGDYAYRGDDPQEAVKVLIRRLDYS